MRADYPKVTYKQHTFLSSLVSGLSMIIIITIACGTIIAVYGMNLAGQKSEEFMLFAQGTLQGLPEIVESLPPLASDIFNSQRDPEYRDKIEIVAEPVLLPQNRGRLGASITITNKGSMVVSLMSLRIVILDKNKNILAEMNKWVVTPFACKKEWPGPLMPDSKRYISALGENAYNIPNIDDLKVEVEVTEIRIWDENQPVQIMDPNFPENIEIPAESMKSV